MSLQSCYAAVEGDYEGVIGRLRSEKLVQKFVLKFLDDGSYDLLCQSLESKNYEEAFRAAHTLKGVCQNLNFTKLYQSSAELNELIRHGWDEAALPVIERVKADYEQTVVAIRAFQAEIG